jgi:hypothetical protein
MMPQYSDDPRVNDYAAKLIEHIDEPNPYSADKRPGTIARVISDIRYGFGDAKANAVRITVH